MSDSNFSAIRARLKYESIEEFIGGYARFISAGGMFIPMAPAKLKPVGTTIRFQFLIADGSTALLGEGMVVQVRPPEEGNPKAPVGMLIKYTKLSQESKNLVDQIVAMKEFGSLPGSHPEPAPQEPQAEVEAEAAAEPDEDGEDPTRQMSVDEYEFIAQHDEQEQGDKITEAGEDEPAEGLDVITAASDDEIAEEQEGEPRQEHLAGGPRKLGQTEGGLQILAFDDMSDEEADELQFDLGAEESDIDEMFAGLFGGSEGEDDMFGGFGAAAGPEAAEEHAEMPAPPEEPPAISGETEGVDDADVLAAVEITEESEELVEEPEDLDLAEESEELVEESEELVEESDDELAAASFDEESEELVEEFAEELVEESEDLDLAEESEDLDLAEESEDLDLVEESEDLELAEEAAELAEGSEDLELAEESEELAEEAEELELAEEFEELAEESEDLAEESGELELAEESEELAPLPGYADDMPGASLTFPDDWSEAEAADQDSEELAEIDEESDGEPAVSVDEAFEDSEALDLDGESEAEELVLESDAVELIEGSEAEMLLDEESEGDAEPELESFDDLREEFEEPEEEAAASSSEVELADAGPSELENLLGNLESDPAEEHGMDLHLSNDPLAAFAEEEPEAEPGPVDEDDEESLDFLLAVANKEIEARQSDEPEDDEEGDILDDLLGDVANLPPPPSDEPMFNQTQAQAPKKKKGFLSKLFGKD